MLRERPAGLFVGLCTLDVIQLVDRAPGANEKLTARDQEVAAGGPAANAAVTFAHLGGAAGLVTAIGRHPLGVVATADLHALGVTVTDLAAASTQPPAVSSVLVTASTGERAVASTNATRHRLTPPDDLDALVAACDIVEFDGHHMELAVAAARAARTAGRTTVFDGGSWKPGTEDLLPLIDVAVCSSDFHPPGTHTPTETLRFLREHGVAWSAVSGGADPIAWAARDVEGTVEVPPVRVADTLGAGDVLHGVLAHHLARRGGGPTTEACVSALRSAAAVASRACASFGTRAWMGNQGPT